MSLLRPGGDADRLFTVGERGASTLGAGSFVQRESQFDLLRTSDPIVRVA